MIKFEVYLSVTASKHLKEAERKHLSKMMASSDKNLSLLLSSQE
jgi:hypothetical protein